MLLIIVVKIKNRLEFILIDYCNLICTWYAYLENIMNNMETSITLNVNSAAFSGKDIDLMDPDGKIQDKYYYKCEKEFRSSHSGPGSWFLEIILTGVGFCIATTAKAYLNELGKDLYEWSKEYLKPIFKKNKKGDGCIIFSYHNKKILIEIPNPSEDHFENIWLEFSQIIEIIKKHPWRTVMEYQAEWNEVLKRWILKPIDVHTKIILRNVFYRCKWFIKNVFRRFLHDNYMIASSILTFFLTSIFYILVYFFIL